MTRLWRKRCSSYRGRPNCASRWERMLVVTFPNISILMLDSLLRYFTHSPKTRPALLGIQSYVWIELCCAHAGKQTGQQSDHPEQEYGEEKDRRLERRRFEKKL